MLGSNRIIGRVALTANCVLSNRRSVLASPLARIATLDASPIRGNRFQAQDRVSVINCGVSATFTRGGGQDRSLEGLAIALRVGHMCQINGDRAAMRRSAGLEMWPRG
ncbi:hypothetical protein MPC4_190026 [Methylocella tundrae]|uniref:Uncharacterized protein n=1 Tax=Methylocella tundrae TaxID=227605 RepID=A0A8B6M5T3_METTU|nr:hypothetical protein MPC1_560006 [Methylocella tundrae]VTZ49713.1 hypothetical protein MPC4_190026 [Methylocella tundrae]